MTKEEKIKEVMDFVFTYGNHRELSGYFDDGESASLVQTHTRKADKKYEAIESKLRELIQ